MRNTEPTPIRRDDQLHAPHVPSLLATAPRLEGAQAQRLHHLLEERLVSLSRAE